MGEPAPGFDAPALVDGDLGRVKLSDYAGSYVVLFFYPLDFTFVVRHDVAHWIIWFSPSLSRDVSFVEGERRESPLDAD